MVDEFLRVKGAEGVWAAGDVVDVQASQLVYTGELFSPIVKGGKGKEEG
jgi:NADH dehydrogenase FAD-containing subunit